MAKYEISLEAHIHDNDRDGDEVLSTSRVYFADTLDAIETIVAHFGKSMAVLVDGAEIGLAADLNRDAISPNNPVA